MALGTSRILNAKSVDITEELVSSSQKLLTMQCQLEDKGKCKFKDSVFLTKKDPRMFARVEDRLTMNEEFELARKAFAKPITDLETTNNF